MINAIRFLNVVFAGVVAGAMFGIWAGQEPATLSATAYVEVQQASIRSLNELMPALGAVTIVLTLVSALLQRRVRPLFIVGLMGAVCFAASGLITRFGNQPINAVVMTWSAQDPPADWMALRDRWWQLHQLRTTFALLGLGLIVAVSVVPRRAPAPDR